MIIWQILLTIFLVSLLILIHELGHFLMARLFRVTVHEFAIGMGPKLFSRVSKKSGTRYSVRALPIGGFVSMEGEDEETEPDAEGSLNSKPVWQRMLITAAGAIVNLIAGLLIIAVLVISSASVGGTQIADFREGALSQSAGLEAGDTVLKIGNRDVHVAMDLSYAIMHDGKEPVSVTVRRNGEILTFESVTFPTQVSGGHLFGDMDFYVYAVPKTVPEVIKQTFWQSVNTVTMIWESIFDLLGGEYTVNDLSGPVGLGEAIGSAAKQGPDSLVYFVAFLTFNLGILNLLPLPALDGGRLFFQFIELIFRRPVNRKVEGYIHAGGLVLLLLLMGYVTFHDIWKLFQ